MLFNRITVFKIIQLSVKTRNSTRSLIASTEEGLCIILRFTIQHNVTIEKETYKLMTLNNKRVQLS